MYDEMYILSTFIFVIHKVFYEAKNGQAESPEGQIAWNPDAGQGFARGKLCDRWSYTTVARWQIGMDTESVAFRCGE
jgi:hypothetical protein